jgi:hypothetical protein
MKTINNESLCDVFDIDFETEDTTITKEPADMKDSISKIESALNEKDYVDDQLKNLLRTANSLLSAASDLISTTLDPEAISSASSMINSVSNIISEINKSVLIEKKFKMQQKLEQMKIEAREKHIMLRNSESAQLGSGNNITNNFLQFNQETIVKQILEAQKTDLLNK